MFSVVVTDLQRGGLSDRLLLGLSDPRFTTRFIRPAVYQTRGLLLHFL